ncbi:MAG: hypothetical protein WCR31_10670 [Treponema sp.]
MKQLHAYCLSYVGKNRCGRGGELFAEKLGNTKQRVSNMEHNLKPVGRRMAYRLAGIFGILAGRFM